jgi:hypothetical protein
VEEEGRSGWLGRYWIWYGLGGECLGGLDGMYGAREADGEEMVRRWVWKLEVGRWYT